MGSGRRKGLLVSVVLLLALTIVVVGGEVYGYSTLSTGFDATGVSPDVDVSVSSFGSALLNLLSGDLFGTAASFIKGANIEGTLTFENKSFLPVYLPNMDHSVYIEGHKATKTIHTAAFWIGPFGLNRQQFSVTVGTDSLPEIALASLARGGEINIRVESSFELAGFRVIKTKNEQRDVMNALASYANSSSTGTSARELSVTSFGFSPNPTTVGKVVSTSVTFSGGGAGTYTLGIWKDISLAADELVTSYSISHDGTASTKSVSFTPARQGSYHLGITYGGSTVWSQPNDASRLVVQSNIAAFSVTSFGFSPNPTTVGKAVSTSVTFSGGGAGTYTLGIWKDISLAADELVTSYSISHDGTTSTKSVSFTPARQGNYHLGLTYGGSTVWSQPNDSSRLTVVAATPRPFSVTYFAFNPVSIKLGSTTSVEITVVGGTAGTYSLGYWRDISLWPDEQVGSLNFQHDGISTTTVVQFRPTTTGTFHGSVMLGGQTLWSQRDDGGRLKVT